MFSAVGPGGIRRMPEQGYRSLPKKKSTFLAEVLMNFPDPYSLDRNGRETRNKHEETLDIMDEQYKEQRRRLLERHTIEHAQWSSDTHRMIDWDRTFHLHHPQTRPSAIMLPGSWSIIKGPEAIESLQRYPASERSTLVCAEQFKVPSNLSDKDEYKVNDISSTEFAAEIAKQGVQMRKRMLREEQDLRLFQVKSKEVFYEVLLRNDPEKYGRNGTNSKKAREAAKPVIPTAAPAGKNHSSQVGLQRSSTHPEAGKSSNNSVRATDPRRPLPPTQLTKPSVPSINLNPAQTADSRPPGAATSRDPRLAITTPTGPRNREGTSTSFKNPFASRREEPTYSSNEEFRRPESRHDESRHDDSRRPDGSHFPNVFGRREEPVQSSSSSSNPYSRREEQGPFHSYGRRDREDRHGSFGSHVRRRSRSPPPDLGNRRLSGSSAGGCGDGKSPKDIEMEDDGEAAYQRRKSMVFSRR